MKDPDVFHPERVLFPQMLPRLWGRLGRFSYSVHNIIGHPLAEMFWIIGLNGVGDYIHDITVPSPDTKED